MSPTRSWRDHLRAGLIALHMLALLIMCLPVPGSPDAARKKGSMLHKQVQDWRKAAKAVGIRLSQEEAVDLAVDVATRMRKVRSNAAGLVKPYIRRVGAGQSWQMFGAVVRTPGRLRIELFEGGTWRDLYVHGDDSHAWNGRLLYSERVRALMTLPPGAGPLGRD
jgi:hypothetical protein